jgi:PIN domain nuclease of toxin-antitoxin system
MIYLIDTCTFLWYVEGSELLSKNAKDLISDTNNEIHVSIASLWEISIKHSLQKLQIKDEFDSVLIDIIQNNFEILPINFKHTSIQNKLNYYHKDPFDRMIVSQAISENYNLISSDAIFDKYLEAEKINRIW